MFLSFCLHFLDSLNYDKVSLLGQEGRYVGGGIKHTKIYILIFVLGFVKDGEDNDC